MTGVFVDTNVLLYSADTHDQAKRSQAIAWLDACWKRRCGRVSTQVLNEFYVNSLRNQQCAVLLTEDMQHGQHMAGVQIVDPFQAGPDMLPV